jgi:hypothetical protein
MCPHGGTCGHPDYVACRNFTTSPNIAGRREVIAFSATFEPPPVFGRRAKFQIRPHKQAKTRPDNPLMGEEFFPESRFKSGLLAKPHWIEIVKTGSLSI